jgi:hypothetical protein
MSRVVKFVPVIMFDKHSWGLGLENRVIALDMVEISTGCTKRVEQQIPERVLTLKTSTEATPQAG